MLCCSDQDEIKEGVGGKDEWSELVRRERESSQVTFCLVGWRSLDENRMKGINGEPGRVQGTPSTVWPLAWLTG